MQFPNRLSSSHDQRSCWCSVVLPAGPGKCSSRCLALSASEKNFWGFTFPSLAPTFLSPTFLRFALTFSSLTFPSLALTLSSLTFPSLALTFLSLAHTFTSLTLRVLLFQASPFELDSHSFGPHPVGSLHLFPLHQILVCGTVVLS